MGKVVGARVPVELMTNGFVRELRIRLAGLKREILPRGTERLNEG